MAQRISLADTPNESRQMFKGGMFLFAALAFGIGMGWGVPGEAALLAGAVPADAVVTSNAKSSNRINKKTATRLVYRYQAGGKTYEGDHETIDDDLIAKAAVDKPIAIERVSFWPSVSRIRGESYSFFGWLGLPLGVGLGLVGAFSFVPAFRSRRRRHAAFRHGAPARGRIVTRNGDQDARTRRLMGVIEYEYAVEGRTYVGALWGESHQQTSSSFPCDELIVFYDPKHPSAHAVWIEDDFDSL